GQVMPLRRYQILLSETAVQQKAYALGIAEAGSQLTEQQKVLARQALIFDQRSEEHTSELQSRENLVCRLLLEKKKTTRHAHEKPGRADALPVAKCDES